MSNSITDYTFHPPEVYPSFSMQWLSPDKVYLFSKNELKASVAYTLCLLYDSGKCPRNLEIIIDKVDDFISNNYQIHNECFIELSVNQIKSLGNKLASSIKEIENLNLSNNEIRSGITDASDPNRYPSITITSRYSTIPKDDSFIDLGAFGQMLAYTLCKSVYAEQ